MLVWRLDRWGRSLRDLVTTLEELNHLGVGLVSLTEALDLTTPTGRAMAGLLSVFAAFEHEILRERVALVSPMPGKMASSSADRQQLLCNRWRSANSIVPASARLRSPGGSTSAGPRSAGFSLSGTAESSAVQKPYASSPKTHSSSAKIPAQLLSFRKRDTSGTMRIWGRPSHRR